MEAGIKRAFESFLASDDLESAFISSTKASWAGTGHSYSVELFPDEHYRVLYSDLIGNLYESPGLILTIPPLSDGDYDPEEEDQVFITEAIELLRAAFAESGQE